MTPSLPPDAPMISPPRSGVCVCVCVLERNRVCECSTDYVAWVYHRERGRKAEGGLGGRGKEAETETGAEKQRG